MQKFEDSDEVQWTVDDIDMIIVNEQEDESFVVGDEVTMKLDISKADTDKASDIINLFT